ncbi:flagellar basal body rod protein FlgB [Planctomicrobium sp.]|jgi:flagellar basal-body rod protein FlgB|nr:flagellar basal body rod protein FlgB [Planctomicrobium sp.]MBT5020635.1 flagellar basal body rod protein FlgB [Planctomicrobium sp.]MDB4733516.1 flagellar basal body rod protein FlgB [Planctomicrobium sp.]
MIQFPTHIDQVAALAEVSELRHRVISHNLANANTPNYKRLDVSFDQQLLKAKRERSENLSLLPTVGPGEAEAAGMDGNNVDLDQEVGKLSENSMLFQMYSQIMASHLDSMRRAMQS